MLTLSLQHGRARCSCGDAKARSALVLQLSVASLVLISKESKCLCMVQCLKHCSKGSSSCWLVCPAFRHGICRRAAAHHCLAALVPVVKPLWQSAVVCEDHDGAASSTREVLLALPLALWAEALWGWAVRWFFWPHQEILEPSKPVDVLYQADFSCAVAPGDLS